MNPLQFNDLLISFTSEFLPLWNDKGSGAHKAVGLWRPSTASERVKSSEERYRILVEDSPAMICRYLPDRPRIHRATAGL